MLLQTNSYVVPKDRRAEHQRLMRRFRQTLARLGCDHFEIYEQVGSNWSGADATGRYVQIMKFRDRKHQQHVQQGERTDPTAQALIAEFCELINFPYQQQHGLFAVGFYASVLPAVPTRATPGAPVSVDAADAASVAAGSEVLGDATTDDALAAGEPSSETTELAQLDLDDPADPATGTVTDEQLLDDLADDADRATPAQPPPQRR
jgi:hypothetical protein